MHIVLILPSILGPYDSAKGEEIEYGYPITCGDSRAVLLFKKFVCPGINVSCVKVGPCTMWKLPTDNRSLVRNEIFFAVFFLTKPEPCYSFLNIATFLCEWKIRCDCLCGPPSSSMSSSSAPSSLSTWRGRPPSRTGKEPSGWGV